MERLGFPMGGNVDTFLMARKQPDWGSAKGTRRAFVAKDYRVLLNLGDNFGDFVDAYRGSEAERLKVFEENKERWGREWIMLANPAYGSFEIARRSATTTRSRADEQRKAKRDVLDAWKGEVARVAHVRVTWCRAMPLAVATLSESKPAAIPMRTVRVRARSAGGRPGTLGPEEERGARRPPV